MSVDPYKDLGIPENADEGTALLRCSELLQKYNPQNYSDPDVRVVMQEKYIEILDATQIVAAGFGLVRQSDNYFVPFDDSPVPIDRDQSSNRSHENRNNQSRKYYKPHICTEAEIQEALAYEKAVKYKNVPRLSGFMKSLAYIFVWPFIIILTVLQITLTVLSGLLRKVISLLLFLSVFFLLFDIFLSPIPTIRNDGTMLLIYFLLICFLLLIGFGHTKVIDWCQVARDKFKYLVR